MAQRKKKSARHKTGPLRNQSTASVCKRRSKHVRPASSLSMWRANLLELVRGRNVDVVGELSVQVPPTFHHSVLVPSEQEAVF